MTTAQKRSRKIMEDSNMHELVTVAAPLWQWALGVLVALLVWETYLENVWYKFKNWIMKK